MARSITKGLHKLLRYGGNRNPPIPANEHKICQNLHENQINKLFGDQPRKQVNLAKFQSTPEAP
jgi:hypothetical protein